MILSKLFTSQKRINILKYILPQEKPLTVTRIAKDLKLSKGLVSGFFNTLTSEGILKKSVNGYIVNNNHLVKALNILINLVSIDISIFTKYNFVKGVGIYGSSVKGTNTEDSDIDTWILVGKDNEEMLAKLTAELKNNYPNIKPLFLTQDKLSLIKNEDPIFYYSLYFGSVNIWGEGLESV
ncbi:MAG: hypothetical protein DDT41_00415 [candidate division WS2 bacterium]|nr:hypothetical protein [Candidatus Psychracetigena formicireducens]